MSYSTMNYLEQTTPKCEADGHALDDQGKCSNWGCWVTVRDER